MRPRGVPRVRVRHDGRRQGRRGRRRHRVRVVMENGDGGVRDGTPPPAGLGPVLGARAGGRRVGVRGGGDGGGRDDPHARRRRRGMHLIAARGRAQRPGLRALEEPRDASGGGDLRSRGGPPGRRGGGPGRGVPRVELPKPTRGLLGVSDEVQVVVVVVVVVAGGEVARVPARRVRPRAVRPEQRGHSLGVVLEALHADVVGVGAGQAGAGLGRGRAAYAHLPPSRRHRRRRAGGLAEGRVHWPVVVLQKSGFRRTAFFLAPSRIVWF